MQESILRIMVEVADLGVQVAKNTEVITSVEQVAEVLISCLKHNKKILIAGNGGSAAEAQHFAAELVCRFERDRKGFPAIALTTDASILTAWGNDCDFHDVFARQIGALGSIDDVFFGISTSGNSKNVIEGLKVAKEKGLITIGLIGNNGGKMKELCDYSIIVPATNTARIQEVQLMIIHILSGLIETHGTVTTV